MLNLKDYIGCFPSTSNEDALTNSGLNTTMISDAGFTSGSIQSQTGVYLASSKAMTIEKCVTLCLANGFFLAGLNGWNG